MLYKGENVNIMIDLVEAGTTVDCVYADMIYENPDFFWVIMCYDLLREDGVFYVQLDQTLVAEMKLHLDKLFGKKNFINWIVTLEDWGGRSKRCFGKKHDDILMYSKGKNYKFHAERIMIPKITAGTAFDKNGGMKIPPDNWADLGNFSTVSKERVKLENGKNIQWQKSLKLMNRLLLPVTDEGDTVLDPFMGSGTTGVWCARNKRNFIGIEIDDTIFKLAEERIQNEI